MNQILDYTPNNGGKKSSGSDKIVRVFAVIIIIFALCLVASGVYGIYKRSQEGKNTTETAQKAKIEVTQEATEAIIKVTHVKAIEKIIYSWNNGKETTIKATGESTLEESIPLPAGENTLHVKVIDIDGQESTYEGQFTSETGEDILNPVIKLDVEGKNLKITATDETSLDFITYHWNDEEEIRVEASEEDKKTIVVETEILRGVNDLIIVAVDSNNNTTTETKSFTGITKPEITITVSEDKTKADILVTHESGIKDITLNWNDVEYPITLSEENPKEQLINIDLLEGNNKIVVTANSVEGTQTVAEEEVSNNTLAPTEMPDDTTPEEPTATEPVITIEKSEDGMQAILKASHESGIKDVKLNVNDVDFAIDGIVDNPTDIELAIDLVDGNNRITFTVIPVNGQERQVVEEIVK